jgi:hypothetical protein
MVVVVVVLLLWLVGSGVETEQCQRLQLTLW